ncbi:amino acid ABC transporter substrate-binding protein [Kocuria rhizophila]|uniref:amino acid ABC transporter substrate-binding protein n=1 Tax=Kocuria rhizophila TaxID=72000 RepID=UPI0007505F48|nr:amino acid ABC transporter substrate-binding protein [Kocuria rhizophila]KUP26905.1 amino acid ABC transporter substrate-binding protein [Kocuria rhizophila]
MSPHRPTRRAVLGATGLVGLSAVLAACSSPSGAPDGSATAPTEDVLQRIQDAGEVRIGMEGTFRPYGYHDGSGALVGFEKEIAELIARDLGVRATFVETQWDSLIAGVDAGRYDLVLNNIAPTDKRKEKFDFSVPYAVSEGRVGVAKDSPLTSVDQVPGHTAAQTETSNFGQTMAQQGAQLVPVTGFDEAVMLVTFGRVDMTGNDFVTFQSFFDQRPDAEIRLLEGGLGEPSESAVLMPLNQPRLRSAVDASLTTHMDNGDLKRIYEKYVSTDLTPEP